MPMSKRSPSTNIVLSLFLEFRVSKLRRIANQISSLFPFSFSFLGFFFNLLPFSFFVFRVFPLIHPLNVCDFVLPNPQLLFCKPRKRYQLCCDGIRFGVFYGMKNSLRIPLKIVVPNDKRHSGIATRRTASCNKQSCLYTRGSSWFLCGIFMGIK